MTDMSTIALREWLLDECPSGRGAAIVVDAINAIERLERQNADLLAALRAVMRAQSRAVGVLYSRQPIPDDLGDEIAKSRSMFHDAIAKAEGK